MKIIKQLINWDKLSDNERLELKSLKELNLSHYHLINIPESTGKLEYIKRLWNKGPWYDEFILPEAIWQLTRLTKLDLSWNNLTSLPESIGNLKNLQELNLNCNKLISLPESIRELTRLKELSLFTNQLTSLPESLCELLINKAAYSGNILNIFLNDFKPVKNYLLFNKNYVYDLRLNKVKRINELRITDKPDNITNKQYLIHEKTGIDYTSIREIDENLTLQVIISGNPLILEKINTNKIYQGIIDSLYKESKVENKIDKILL